MADERDNSRGPFSLYAIVTALVVVTAVVGVVFFAAYQTCSFAGCPEIDEVQGYVPDEASVVLDRNEEEIGKLFRVNRVVVELDALPEYVPEAFVATEDGDFYEHSGVDWSRAVGALVQNIRQAGIEEGFSTITMQVARNVFPEQLPAGQRTLDRKISEIKVARALEDRYTKDQILALYLNQIYFGSGAWGIESASQEYFGKSAPDLDLGEAALLAGLPQAPSNLNPRTNMEGALERRRTVLRRMVDQGYITDQQADEVRDSEPELARSRIETPDRAAYFVETVRQQLEERLGDEIYTRGYTIHTTLDLAAQAAAEEELSSQLTSIESGRYGSFPHPSYNSVVADTAQPTGRTSPYLQGAVVTLAAGSGDVLAMVGGRDFEDSKYNRAVQAKRQPGSAFKPFVYAAALQNGYPPSTVLEDTPYRTVRDGREWAPRNFDGSYSGEITMRDALTHSKNVATIRLAEQIGLGRVIDMARRLGIRGDIPHYPSIAIGASEVTVLEMTAAYAAFATLGDRPEPRFITRVEDRQGNLVYQVPPRSQNALASDVAFLTVDLMRGVVDRGTGAAVRAAGFSAPAAGKTGTTNESADVWFIGFTPEIVTAVWIGMDDPQRIMPRATGGRLAAPVWGRIMRRVAVGSGGWSPPPGVERHMVDERGNVVASNCPTVGELREEYFLRGSVNTMGCNEYIYGYGDTLGADTLGESDESWWRRLRERVFRDEQDRADTTRANRPDTIIMEGRRDTLDWERRRQPTDTLERDRRRQQPRDTVRLTPQPPDTTPRPEPEDTMIGRPARQSDTVPPPDTMPAPAAAPAADGTRGATEPGGTARLPWFIESVTTRTGTDGSPKAERDAAR